MSRKSCAFTGHRAKKLPWRYDETAAGCIRLKQTLAGDIAKLVDVGYTDFLSGMAEGTDTWAAMAVLELRKTNPSLKLHCILPCREQADSWTTTAQETYQAILEQADSVTYVSETYHKNCMMERNCYLVDHASLLLAVYNGEWRGGTAATVRYARKIGREIIIIDPRTCQVTG